MPKKPKISVVIRAYNEEKHLPELFHRLKRQTISEFEIILVDSGSQDDTVPIAKEGGAKIVKILKQNFSFGRALNIGCAAASGEFLLFVSAHVYPESDDWLEIILAEFKDKQVGLVYGRQRAGKTNKFSEEILLKNWFPDKTERHQGTAFCNNANCAIRAKIWKDNRYDEVLTGLEDLAWAKTIQSKGWHINYNHKASIIHIHDESWKQVYNRYLREAIALSVIDPSVRMSVFRFLWLFYQNAVSDMRHAISIRKLSIHFFEILIFRFLQFLASWRGMKRPATLDDELIKRFYYPTGD